MAALVDLSPWARGQYQSIYACISGVFHLWLVVDRASIHEDIVVERSEAISMNAWAAMVAFVLCMMRWRAVCTDTVCGVDNAVPSRRAI